MKVADLFDVEYGNSFSLNHLRRSPAGEGVAFVSRSAQNNGVAAWVEQQPDTPPFPAGLLTVSLRSRNHPLATFVQVNPFYTAFHLYVLCPKRKMGIRERLWWAMCIESNRYRYNFGRQANRSLAALELPDEHPAWVDTSQLPEIQTGPLTAAQVSLPPAGAWKMFQIGDLFKVLRGRSVVRRDAALGGTPLVTASSTNNGVTALIQADADHAAGLITVCSNGSVGEAFVQPADFVANQDVTVLEPRSDIPLQARHFICTIIRQEKYRFNYGRKWPAGKLKASSIRLPAEPSGEPDYALMDQYIRSLPLSAVTVPGKADPMVRAGSP